MFCQLITIFAFSCLEFSSLPSGNTSPSTVIAKPTRQKFFILLLEAQNSDVEDSKNCIFMTLVTCVFHSTKVLLQLSGNAPIDCQFVGAVQLEECQEEENIFRLKLPVKLSVF